MAGDVPIATERITLAQILEAAIDNRQIDLHVALPGRVDSYDRATQTVDVTLQIHRLLPDGDGNFIPEALPKLADVPVVFPRCKAFGMTFPLSPGDYVQVLFNERNIGAWRATKAAGSPGDVGMHTLDGAVAIPGLFPDGMAAASASSSNMVLGKDDTPNAQIEITPTEVHLGAGASDNVVTKTDIDAIKTAISGAATVAQDGGAALKTNILSAWPSSVGSTHVKSVR